MDQVLFSEPSTKMKEKIDAIRQKELAELEAKKMAAGVDSTEMNKKVREGSNPEVEALLAEKFKNDSK